MPTRSDKMREITDKLEQGLSGLFESEKYKDYLKVMAKFYSYSPTNCLLIALQKPDATHIAGFSAWSTKFGRQVRKGEKGIRIIAPSPYTKKVETPPTGQDAPDEKTVVGFRSVAVFDISQTDGPPLPEMPVSELQASVEGYEDFLASLHAASPCPIEFESISSDALGYYSSSEGRIVIQPDMGELQTLKTGLHEIAHARLHNPDAKSTAPRRQREVEAESVAYVVLQRYGLDTSEYSFGYIAEWAADKEMSTLKASLASIRATAAAIIDDIDGYLAVSRERSPEPVVAPPSLAAKAAEAREAAAQVASTPTAGRDKAR